MIVMCAQGEKERLTRTNKQQKKTTKRLKIRTNYNLILERHDAIYNKRFVTVDATSRFHSTNKSRRKVEKRSK